MTNDISKKVNQLNEIAHLKDPFSIQQQQKIIREIGSHPGGTPLLLDLLINRKLDQAKPPSYIDSIILKSLLNPQASEIRNKINQYFQEGVVELKSSNSINYRPLYESLILSKFKIANELTLKHLNTLAGIKQDQVRQWLYFTDVMNLPVKDLETIDKLWTIYSEGRFGFSVQKQIWIYSNKDWEKFWHKIGWKINKKNIRYPSEFTWDKKAPAGHLPLFNQIRGVQVLTALFMHPAIKSEQKNNLNLRN